MIAYIKGILLLSWDNFCLVLTGGGVGYELGLPLHTFAQLPPCGEKVEFYTSLRVREDAQELFGFATFEERQTFDILTGISKVGSRTALAILSLYRPADLQAIVQDANQQALTKVSGIGLKTAQHILLELKYKLAAKKVGLAAAPASVSGISSTYADTLEALKNLGYAQEECDSLVRNILKEEPDLDVGGAIRMALKALAKGKM